MSPSSPNDPILNAARLQEIYDLDLTTDELDATLQALVAEAAEDLGLPIALVSVVLEEAQFFAAHHGLGGWLKEVRGTPIEWSFCSNIVRHRQPFVVEDARRDERVMDNPLVLHEGIRAYAGVPLESSRGHVLGSLCVIGDQAHRFSAKDVERLRQIAHRVVERLESRSER